MTVTAQDGTLSIGISDKASEKLRFFAKKEGLAEDFYVKVGVKGGGCSGLLYTLSIEKDVDLDVKVVDHNGVRVFIDKKSYIFLAGMTLDFSDGLNGKGFVFQNPNATKSCGCGTSFGV